MKSYQKSGASEWEGEALALLRRGLYHFVASSLGSPDEDRLTVLGETLEHLDEEYLAAFAFYDSWARLSKALSEGFDISEVRKEYVKLFSAGPKGVLCPPNESSYLAPPGQRALCNIKLDEEYTRLGVSVSSDHKGLPDHVTVEAEVMAFLCGVEAEAWKAKAQEEALRALRNERGFLRDHLSRWFPTFAGLVRRASRSEFYILVAAAADAFITHDTDLIDSLIEGVVT